MIPHEILSTMCLHAASSQPRRRIRWCPWCLAVAALGISRYETNLLVLICPNMKVRICSTAYGFEYNLFLRMPNIYVYICIMLRTYGMVTYVQ